MITAPAIVGARGCAEHLAGDLAAEVRRARRARDEDAGRGRDQQRRDLRGEAVADRQQREVCGSRLANDMLLLHARRRRCPPMRLIATIIDAGDRVALDELRGAVHRAVEVGLARDLGAAVRAPRRR